jgi:hypothetical protein
VRRCGAWSGGGGLLGVDYGRLGGDSWVMSLALLAYGLIALFDIPMSELNGRT